MENKKEVTTTPTKRDKKKEEKGVEEDVDLEEIMSRPIMAKDFAKIIESQKKKPY